VPHFFVHHDFVQVATQTFYMVHRKLYFLSFGERLERLIDGHDEILFYSLMEIIGNSILWSFTSSCAATHNVLI